MTNNLKYKKMENLTTTEFKVPTREEVSQNNQEIIDNLNKALGFVPNLYATIAYSDNGLKRFLDYQNAKTSLTNKTVKEIAFELGYNDEYYFSRFFKKNAEVSPQLYRDTVGFDRISALQ